MVNDGRDKNLPAHHVEKGNPKLNGPFLDDVRADQERAYREARSKANIAHMRVMEKLEQARLKKLEKEAEEE